MDKERSVTQASAALKDIWTAGRHPSAIVLRTSLLQPPGGGQPTLTRLVLPKGIALRFYLLAIFEAQCRLGPDEPWENSRPLSGRGSWSDLVAIDGAYESRSGRYMRNTKAGRELEDLRLRQVQGALKTLEDLGREEALVAMPRGQRGQRLYEAFTLMKETGRGSLQTPDSYTVPSRHWHAAQTITVPAPFFLNGWVQVLNPSEVATWLILRALSEWAPTEHFQSGVYLYGNDRLRNFGLRRDAWEDGCQRLLEFGLIRIARPPEAEGPFAEGFAHVARMSRERYEPHRHQLVEQGFDEDAMKVCLRELTLRQKRLADAAARRTQKASESTS
ncbi:hypothetical protein ACFWII_39035 [Streptomyces sp. NPDC127063]|uniref:hypothetical protein n=1 Tax=Streptomyces sp. NPDC127063 TaxID=3347123 RepID=UPI00364F6AFC